MVQRTQMQAVANSLSQFAAACITDIEHLVAPRRFQSFWLLAGEFSNVFLNAKIMMAAAGYKGTWYLINGAVFTLVFGSVRVLLYGAGLWHIWQTKCALTPSRASAAACVHHAAQRAPVGNQHRGRK